MTREQRAAESNREENIDFIESKIASSSQIKIDRLKMLADTNKFIKAVRNDITEAQTTLETAYRDAQQTVKNTEGLSAAYETAFEANKKAKKEADEAQASAKEAERKTAEAIELTTAANKELGDARAKFDEIRTKITDTTNSDYIQAEKRLETANLKAAEARNATTQAQLMTDVTNEKIKETSITSEKTEKALLKATTERAPYDDAQTALSEAQKKFLEAGVLAASGKGDKIESLSDLQNIISTYKTKHPGENSEILERLEKIEDRVKFEINRAGLEAAKKWESDKKAAEPFNIPGVDRSEAKREFETEYSEVNKQERITTAREEAEKTQLEIYNKSHAEAPGLLETESKKLVEFHESMDQVRNSSTKSPEEKIKKQLAIIEEQVMPGLNSALEEIKRDITSKEVKLADIKSKILNMRKAGTDPKDKDLLELETQKKALTQHIDYKRQLESGIEQDIREAKLSLKSMDEWTLRGKSIDEKIGLMLNATSGLIAAQGGVALCKGDEKGGEALFKQANDCRKTANDYCTQAKEEAQQDRKEFWDNVKKVGKATFHWLAVAIMTLAIVAVAVMCPPAAALLIIPAAYAYKNRETMGISDTIKHLTGQDMKEEIARMREPPSQSKKATTDLGDTDTPHKYVSHRPK